MKLLETDRPLWSLIIPKIKNKKVWFSQDTEDKKNNYDEYLTFKDGKK